MSGWQHQSDRQPSRELIASSRPVLAQTETVTISAIVTSERCNVRTRYSTQQRVDVKEDVRNTMRTKEIINRRKARREPLFLAVKNVGDALSDDDADSVFE